MLQVGDFVSTSVTDSPNRYMYVGAIGNKARLIIPGVPGVMITVSIDKIKRCKI